MKLSFSCLTLAALLLATAVHADPALSPAQLADIQAAADRAVASALQKYDIQQAADRAVAAALAKQLPAVVPVEALAVHAKSVAPSPLPPDPRVCTHCICGCTTTGKCTCQDCDHPKLAPAEAATSPAHATESASRFWLVNRATGQRTACTEDGTPIGASLTPTVTYHQTCSNGVCTTVLDAQGTQLGQPIYYGADSGGCSSGNCSSGASSDGSDSADAGAQVRWHLLGRPHRR